MPGKITVTTTGLGQFTARLTGLSRSLPDVVGAELYRDMVGVMFESQKIVPYDEGDLHDSGETDRPEVNGGRVSVSLHYGGGDVDYALAQHENLDYRHTPPGRAKFLEDPLMAWADDGPKVVVQRAIRGMVRR